MSDEPVLRLVTAAADRLQRRGATLPDIRGVVMMAVLLAPAFMGAAFLLLAYDAGGRPWWVVAGFVSSLLVGIRHFGFWGYFLADRRDEARRWNDPVQGPALRRECASLSAEIRATGAAGRRSSLVKAGLASLPTFAAFVRPELLPATAFLGATFWLIALHVHLAAVAPIDGDGLDRSTRAFMRADPDVEIVRSDGPAPGEARG